MGSVGGIDGKVAASYTRGSGSSQNNFIPIEIEKRSRKKEAGNFPS